MVVNGGLAAEANANENTAPAVACNPHGASQCALSSAHANFSQFGPCHLCRVLLIAFLRTAKSSAFPTVCIPFVLTDPTLAVLLVTVFITPVSVSASFKFYCKEKE